MDPTVDNNKQWRSVAWTLGILGVGTAVLLAFTVDWSGRAQAERIRDLDAAAEAAYLHGDFYRATMLGRLAHRMSLGDAAAIEQAEMLMERA